MMEWRSYTIRCRWCEVEFGVVHNTDEERAAERSLKLHQEEAHAERLAEYRRSR